MRQSIDTLCFVDASSDHPLQFFPLASRPESESENRMSRRVAMLLVATLAGVASVGFVQAPALADSSCPTGYFCAWDGENYTGAKLIQSSAPLEPTTLMSRTTGSHRSRTTRATAGAASTTASRATIPFSASPATPICRFSTVRPTTRLTTST